MKLKQLFLTLMMTILCAVQGWAAFVPGTYYLQTATGTFIDALAVNSNNPGAKFQSTSATAFTFTAVSGGYTIQNASNNNFLLYSTANDWDTKMSASSSETSYDGVWAVAEDANGKISISRQYSNQTKYLGNGNTNAGTGVFSGQTSAVWYTLVEHINVVTGSGTTGTLTGYNIPAGKSFTLTMEVENNGSAFNQWGSSILATGTNAFPEKSTVRNGFQFYLQSSTNGGRLDLVAAGTDHILSSVEYNESFTIVMDYADGSLHVVATDASGNSSETTVSTTLAEITTFAYGLPVGINIKSLDIKIKGNAIDTDDKWHTLKTNALSSGSSFYWYAASTTATELGQTSAAPTDDNLDLYLWKIEGNDTEGYTLVNKATGKYVTNPTNIASDGNSVVRLTSTASKYFYTDDKSFHLASPNEGYFLASYSSSHNTVRLYNESSYAGSVISISAPYEEHSYSVTVIGATEGGVVFSGSNYEKDATLIAYTEVTTGVLTAIPVDGYQSNITMEGTTITVTYTLNQVVDNPQAISDMLNRIGGAGTSDKFVTRLDEGLFVNGKDKFIIGNQDSKPYIQGSSLTAIAAGINWYLNHDAHINISWNQLTADIAGASLPAATAVEKTCDADYRYYLNYCTFGYSMTTWTWDRWQKEIDWMALHGINMPLQIIGLEEVWRKLLVQYHYTDDEAKAFAAGPAFTAWWGMNNLEGWGGTTDDAWFARQAKLGKDICDRMKELGMQPVLPGFAAIVPHDFTSKNPAYASESQGNWGGSFVRPWIMDPSGEKFSEVAEKYYVALEEVLGKSKYYSMDPFHEGGAISSGKYSEGYKAIYDAMNTHCGSDTKWVIQQWQWAGGYQRNSLTAVPAGRLIVLDLFADGQPAFDSYNGYAPQEAVFSTIPNFGGRSGFMGRLDNMASNYFTYKGKYSTIKGIGAAPEAIESVPVVYDLLFELPWMGSAPNVTAWVADYATNRYGSANANAQKAWESIHQSAMAFGADAIQGPIEDVWAARPNLDATPASKWGKTIANAATIYTPERRQKLISAVYDLIGENANLSGSNYQYDIIEAGGQVMADYAYDLLLGIKAAKTANNTELFNKRKDAFLNLILGMDAFKGTHQMFRLGNWTQTARDAAAEIQGATTATPDWYELDNARTIITTWGDKGPSEWGLRDYSYRSWQGMLKDYYYPRWKYYFDHDCTAPSAGWFYSEWNWAHELEGEWGASAKGTQMKSERTYYSPTPEGNTVDEAEKLMAKYILPVQLNDKSIKYVYRALETDLTSVLTVDAVLGAQVALPIVGNTDIDGENVTVIVKIDGTELVNRTIPNDATQGEHNAEYIVSDGTVIRFKVNVDNTFSTGDITGNDKVHFMHARDYITNVDEHGEKKYNEVPQGKAWQMKMDVIHTTGQKDSYNKWGSCILSSSSDPFNTFYWNNFQVYEHSAPRKTLNFKSNKGDGNDHVIAQGHQVLTDAGYEDYQVIVRYDGNQTYLIRTIILDSEGNPTDQVFNNVWFAARVQHDIDVMSCALPTGTNLKTLRISIAEESNLLEDVDYAIYNNTTREYLSSHYQNGPVEHYFTSDHASKFQIEFTDNNDLAYHDGDGGLHPTIYIKAEVFNEVNRNIEWKYLGLDNKPVDDKANAIPYLYSSNSGMIEPINNSGTGEHVTSSKGSAWSIGDFNQWSFIFFGNYLVQVAKKNVNVGKEKFGGITYKRTPFSNNDFVALPTNAQQTQIPNTSEVGYSATITMDGTMLRVNYTPLDDTFYNFTDLDLYGSGTTLYYWYKEQNKLVKYSTGTEDDWNELEGDKVINGKGDCTKWSIAKATTIPVTTSKNKNGGSDSFYYGTLYSPVCVTLPEGMRAYTANVREADETTYLDITRIAEGGDVLPAKTGVILYSEDVSDADQIAKTFRLEGNNTDNFNDGNALEGVFLNLENPKNGTYYTLSRKSGMGFYRYTGTYLNAFKAFIRKQTANARFVFNFLDDTETAIEGIFENLADDNAVIYDLQGRRVNNITKGGIYIVNGKKVMK